MQGVATGCWALLQNCHLGIKFLNELEQRLANKDLEEIDPEFRYRSVFGSRERKLKSVVMRMVY